MRCPIVCDPTQEKEHWWNSNKNPSFEVDHTHLGVPGKQFPKQVYSQRNQDYILARVFEKIGTTNSPPFCVEFGFSNRNSRKGSNTGNLVVNKKWRSLLLDGGNENSSMNLHRQFLTSDNIVKTFDRYSVPVRPEYVSIDVDSTDMWLCKALLESNYRPMVYSVEYNANFPIQHAISHPNRRLKGWQNDSFYGASLKALYLIARQHNYHIIAIEKCLDIFFVDGSLLDRFGELPPLDHWCSYAGVEFNNRVKNPNDPRLSMLIDYEVWLRTGDTEQSEKSPASIAARFLVDFPDRPPRTMLAK